MAAAGEVVDEQDINSEMSDDNIGADFEGELGE